MYFYNPCTAVSIFLIYVCLIRGPSVQPGRLTKIPPELCLINGQYSVGFSSLKKLEIKPIAFHIMSMTPYAKILNKSPQHHT